MAITDPITGAETLGDDLIGLIKQVTNDPKQQAQLVAAMQDKLVSAAQASDTTQAQIMAAEAAQKGWINKPHLIGAFVCLGALFLDVLMGQAVWLSYALGHPFPEPPKFLTDQLSTMLEGLFGLGGLSVTHGLVKQHLANQ